MFNWPWIKKPMTIHRDELRVLMSRQLDDQDFVPLDREYILVPSHRWLIGKTPVFPWWIKDCNKRAHLTKAKMLDHCAGMCIIKTIDPKVDHCLLIVCFENKEIWLYDPSLHTLMIPKYYNIKRMWF